MTQDKWRAYCCLMRINKPIGTLLLLWPTLWALWLAAGGMPQIHIVIVFMLGVCLMRAAGCVLNDHIDRHIDGHVKRTAGRPLPSGALNEQESQILFVILITLSFGLVLTLNGLTIRLSLAALALTWIYPWMKRITALPQVVLGVTFGWSIPMGFAAVSQHLPLTCWLLLLANICWTVVYDTQYAMVDRDDDVRIGVKSTAILFGLYDRLMIGVLQLATLLLLLLVGYLARLTTVYYGAVLLAGGFFIYQQTLTAQRQRDRCFRAFLNNNYVGLVLFLGIFFNYHGL